MGGTVLKRGIRTGDRVACNKRTKGDSEIKVGLGRGESENATKDTKALSFEERLCVKTARVYASKRRFKGDNLTQRLEYQGG